MFEEMKKTYHLEDHVKVGSEDYMVETVKMFPIKCVAEYHDYPFYTIVWKNKPSAPLLEIGSNNWVDAERNHKRVVSGLCNKHVEMFLAEYCKQMSNH